MQSRFDRIVVPTDFSDTADTAIRAACEVAAYYKSALDIITVVDTKVYAYAGYPFAPLAAQLTEGAEESLNAMKLPPAAKGLNLNRYILSGVPAREIVEYAARVNAGLIAIGTHGYGPLARFVLGSVADRVLHEAKCAVLVTKAPKAKVKHPKKKAKAFTKILFPTDFSETANLAMARAVGLAEDFNAELFVLHVVDDLQISTHVQKEREVILRDLRDHALEQMKKDLPAELLEHFATIGAVKRGEPGKEITTYAQVHGCDLIVMGSHGRTGVGRVLLGSVTDKVVRTAGCPVLVERAK